MHNIRAAGASLKRGQYRAAPPNAEQQSRFKCVVYACRTQLTIESDRALFKDCIRSIKRGLGPAGLERFFRRVPAWATRGLRLGLRGIFCRRLWTNSCWPLAFVCKREMEMASASGNHLYFRRGDDSSAAARAQTCHGRGAHGTELSMRMRDPHAAAVSRG